jgi:hypothetical protein
MDRFATASTLALALLAPLTVFATAQRTFVASTGVDTHPCSLTAPCRSFARAITQTNAGGEVIVLDSAGYGPVTVTKAVSIVSPAGIHAGISVLSGNDGITVNAGAGDDVVLRGLSINGQGGGTGINLVQAGRVRVESCVIAGMAAVGIAHSAANTQLIVVDTIVRDNAGGIVVHAEHAEATLDRVRIEGNSGDGFYIAPPLGGTYVHATISDSVFANNAGDAIAAETVGGARTIISVNRSIIANNIGNGFRAFVGAAPGAVVNAYLSHNAIDSNDQGFGVVLQGTVPGEAAGFLDDNSVKNGSVQVYGAGAVLFAGANTVFGFVECSNGASLYTYGNNMATLVNDGTCVVVANALL